jgi:hypothetical protein
MEPGSARSAHDVEEISRETQGSELLQYPDDMNELRRYLQELDGRMPDTTIKITIAMLSALITSTIKPNNELGSCRTALNMAEARIVSRDKANKQPIDFTKFPDLPTELRQMI